MQCNKVPLKLAITQRSFIIKNAYNKNYLNYVAMIRVQMFLEHPQHLKKSSQYYDDDHVEQFSSKLYIKELYEQYSYQHRRKLNGSFIRGHLRGCDTQRFIFQCFFLCFA